MQQGFFRASGMVIHDHHTSKNQDGQFKLSRFSCEWVTFDKRRWVIF